MVLVVKASALARAAQGHRAVHNAWSLVAGSQLAPACCLTHYDFWLTAAVAAAIPAPKKP